MNQQNLDPEEASKEVRKMVNGYRNIEDDDFALLEIPGEAKEYWVRKDKKWIKADFVPLDIKNGAISCIITDSCLFMDDSCNSEKEGKFKLKKEILEDMYKEFSLYQSVLEEDSKKKLEDNLRYQINFIKILRTFHKNKILKYNNQKLKLGLSIEEINEQNISPYAALRDKILGQDDYTKKQNDILLFSTKFTRPADHKEISAWRYCIETGTKLLPTFFVTLASAFLSGQNYQLVLDEVCTSVGTISDDGDAWVDKYSGYTITQISYSSEEGYNSNGQKLVNRTMIQEDLGEALIGSNKSKIIVGPNTAVILKIIETMSSYMYVILDDFSEFIINQTTGFIDTHGETLTEYSRWAENEKKKGEKRISSFEDRKNLKIILSCLCYIFIALQTAIPSIKSGKSFPNCKRSFDGYPLHENDKDISGITYFACIVSKLTKTSKPWNTLQKQSEKQLILKIKGILNQFILIDPVIKDMYEAKRQYLLSLKDAEEVIIDSINDWYTFLPPLKTIEISTIAPASKEFIVNLVRSVKSGNFDQWGKKGTAQGKIISLSIFIQKLIQNIIQNAKPLLLTGNMEPFVDNVCCNKKFIGISEYLNSKDPTIEKVNNSVEKLNNYLYTFQIIQKAKYLFDPRDTREIYPKIPDIFQSETIIQGFILFCKYFENVPLPYPELEGVCLDRNDYLIEDNSSMEQKIKLVQSKGTIFTLESFENLLDVVNKNNKIDLDLNPLPFSPKDKCKEIIELCSEFKELNFLDTILENLSKGLFSFFKKNKVERGDTRQFKDNLYSLNEKLSHEIMSYLNDYSSILSKNKKIITEFIKGLDKWPGIESKNNEEKIDSLFLYIQFIKSISNNLCIIFPNIIINRVDFTEVKRKLNSWDSPIQISFLTKGNMSITHQSDIIKMIKIYYKELKSLYDSDTNNLFKSVYTVGKTILTLLNQLIQSIPYETPDCGLKTSFLDEEALSMLNKCFILSIFKIYINSALQVPRNVYIQNEPSLPLQSLNPEDNKIDELLATEISLGSVKQENEVISSTLVAFIQICNKQKDDIGITSSMIKDRILRIKEREKDDMTIYLKDLTEEEREVQNIHKNSKLGKWGIGLTKSLIQYDPEAYDADRERIEEKLILNHKLGRLDNVDSMHLDVFEIDLLDNEQANIESNQEANDLTGLPNDDDYNEDLDGDEYY